MNGKLAIPALGFLLCCLGTHYAVFTGEAADNAVSTCKQDFRIFVDVGHDRMAPGAVSARGKTEFEFNVRLAETLQKTLEQKGYQKIKLFISKGGSDSLKKRVQEAGAFKADAFISIHHDDVQDRYKSFWTYESVRRPFSDVFRGYSLFISKKSATWPQSLKLATFVADAFLRRGMTFTKHHAEQIHGEGRTLLDDRRGIYQYDDLIVLKDSTWPAVLMEAGVIVNRHEELILGTKARRELFSEAVVEALQQFCVEVVEGNRSKEGNSETGRSP
jgi:N-acetylmuramoyl-L-alanine amidase